MNLITNTEAIRNLLQKLYILDVKVVNQYIAPYILNTSVKKCIFFQWM